MYLFLLNLGQKFRLLIMKKLPNDSSTWEMSLFQLSLSQRWENPDFIPIFLC